MLEPPSKTPVFFILHTHMQDKHNIFRSTGVKNKIDPLIVLVYIQNSLNKYWNVIEKGEISVRYVMIHVRYG